MRLAAIVEGHGEVHALPVLLRRLCDWLPVGHPVVHVDRPHRLGRSKLIARPAELERALRLTRLRADATLVLMDADDDPACVLAPELLLRCRASLGEHPVGVVLAEREYESWFLAGAESLAGAHALPEALKAPQNHATLRDAKGWLGERMAGGANYSPVIHQPKLSARIDLALVRDRSASFDKLCRTLLDLAGQCPTSPSSR